MALWPLREPSEAMALLQVKRAERSDGE